MKNPKFYLDTKNDDISEEDIEKFRKMWAEQIANSSNGWKMPVVDGEVGYLPLNGDEEE